MQAGTEASRYSGGSGRMQAGTEASRYSGGSGRMMLVCLASGRDEHVVRTDGRLDGMTRRPDG
jgi:hypothetical protein